jgi:formylglycine-generating enzyme required for sulfatase activity
LCPVFDSARPVALAQPARPQWPFDTAEAKRRQEEAAKALGGAIERRIDLDSQVKMTLVLIPAGEFMMGAPAGESPLDPDEAPQAWIKIEKPFWMGKYEVTNQQYHVFDPIHDSRFIDTHWKDRVGPGLPVNEDLQPVVRISWNDAMAFCRWLTEKCKGQGAPEFRLPTEAEWEYACRAGTATPYCFGAAADHLFKYANYADKSLSRAKPWALRDDSQSDNATVSSRVGQYQPNAWGLFDMHGNVAEWCLSVYRAYPYRSEDGRDAERDSPHFQTAKMGTVPAGPRVVRGGSWDDPPRRVRSAFRQDYAPDYRVYNVGFRVVCPAK